ncbi:MAG TPA: methyltransferase domain-containing protein [Anaerolineae bacterium]|nr:methyltransferase domain-containing protein [Anaerolineae bacterium]
MYDDFSSDYDRFVDWPGRLAAELPFIEHQLRAVGARRVLDAACGTGMHALALARRGYAAVGADLSPGMIARARANAAAAGVDVPFEVAGFGELNAQVGTGFDALLCLGNSLPHLLAPADLAAALADFAACLRPGGLVLIQNRNFDAVLSRGERWMEPQAHQEGNVEWLFLRFYDFESDGTLTFNLVTLRREGSGAWRQQVSTTRLWPLRRRELIAALSPAGLGEVTCWGDTQGASFDPVRSPNLVVTAQRTA